MSTDFDALLDAAVERRVEKPNTEDVEVLVGDSLVLLRFAELDSLDWVNLTGANPARPTVPIDREFGYNYDAVGEAAAPLCGKRVDGDVETELNPEQWGKLFKVLAGHDRSKVSAAVFKLNVITPAKRLGEARKKALTPGSGKKRS